MLLLKHDRDDINADIHIIKPAVFFMIPPVSSYTLKRKPYAAVEPRDLPGLSLFKHDGI